MKPPSSDRRCAIESQENSSHNPIFSRRLIKGGLLFVVSALSIAPLLFVGFGVALHDGSIHQFWSDQISQTLFSADGYPHWLVGMNDGLGSPAMYYYPLLPYIVPAFAQGALGWESAEHSLALGVLASMCIAAMGAHYLLRHFVEPTALGVMVYLTAPYCFGTVLYTRGAYAEYCAYAWMPLILLAVMRLRKDCAERRSTARVASGALFLAAGYGALVATHLPTTLVFSLVPIALAAVPVGGYGWLEKSWERWWPLAFTVLGMVLGVGLAAPYLLPAMLMQEHVSMAALTSFHKYNHNFFFGEVGWGRFDLGHEFKQTLYLPFLATAVMGLMGFLLTRGDSRKVDQSLLPSAATVQGGRGRLSWFFLAVLGASVFMMLPWSDFVWRLFPKLQIIQFPWRICSVLTLASTVLLVLGWDSLRKPLTRRSTILAYFAGVAFIGGLTYTGEAVWRFLATSYQTGASAGGDNMEVPEYRPRWAKQDLRTTVQSVRRTPAEVERDRGTTNGVAWVDLTTRPEDPLIGVQAMNASAELAIQKWQSRELRLACANEQPVTLVVSQLYFPGWTARRDGEFLPLRPSEQTGLLEIEVPVGQGEIVITLEPLWPERTGNRVGLASAGVWLIGGVWLLGRWTFKASECSTGESA